MSVYEYQNEIYLDADELYKTDVKVRQGDLSIHVCPVSDQFFIIGMDSEYGGESFDSHDECLDRILEQLELIDQELKEN